MTWIRAGWAYERADDQSVTIKERHGSNTFVTK
jgi:hypothetical protein